jgi:RHS repeat-associated protein
VKTSPLPSPTLPKGGGAIRDIGEKFSANSATGASSFSVPIFTSPGRAGFHPELTLQYDSGRGNGPYGVGWSLSLPRVTRRTDKGLPRYADARDSDTFILSGAEDLVPALVPSASGWRRDQSPRTDENGEAYDVLRFRPRVESLYARIERWTRRSDGDIHWRSFTRDNIATVFGRSPSARIADPADPERRVFSWLLEETRDGKGNIIAYEYKAEDQKGLGATAALERPRPIANAYLERIQYGNQAPDAAADWCFEVLFDYGEHDERDPVNGATRDWTGRQDPFSDFRPTFEVRTHRLCRRVLMLHRFAELGSGWTVVRSTDLTYEENPISTYLRSVKQKGWIRRSDGTYDDPLALPAVDLDYSRPTMEPELHTVDETSLRDLPAGIDGNRYRLLDLDGEGLPGIFTDRAGAFWYKRGDGDGRFGALERIAAQPSIADLGTTAQQLNDIDGSGAKFLVELGRSPPGYFERSGPSWKSFHPFQSLPNLDWTDGTLKYLDLDGDGLPDVLKPEGELFRWWPSLGRAGYGPEQRAIQPRDDDAGPHVVWNDARQAILIADMNGDGLPDLVRVRNGSIEYWPNRGYGRFAPKVVMRNAPRFAADDRFNPSFLRVADIDGSGTADLLYLEPGVARVWMNQSGNGYAAEERVPFPSPADAQVTVTDLLGKGTACLVWSSPLPGDQRRQLRFLDLMSGVKPHLLTSIVNNLGATTTISYAPSTKFYLDDRRAGLPWVTKLPFPTQTVARIEIADAVTGTKLTTTYRYHHGHYDGLEREFAGFGMVEQEDAEVIQNGSAQPESYTPPKRTKTWFHTGAFFDAQTVSTQYAREYHADFLQLISDSVLPSGVAPEQAREATRALRGHVLRQEVYGLDASTLEPHPYVVTESNFEVVQKQPQAGNRYGVFCVHPRETLTVRTERNPADPRVDHDVTIAVDDFGNVRESVHIGYARRGAASDTPQGRTLVTYAQHDYEALDDAPGYYRVDLLRESRSFELTALPAPTMNGIYSHADIVAFLEMVNGVPSATPPVPPADIDFSVSPPPGTAARRLFARTRNLYLGDQPANEQLRALGLLVDTHRVALTPALADSVYGPVVADASARRQLLVDLAYLDQDQLWWVPSGQVSYAADRFYQAHQFTDPFGGVAEVAYDGYALFVVSTTSGAGTPYATTTAVTSDYRVLAPVMLTDANGNRTQVAFDAVGRVTATWLMGKAGEQVGDDAAHPSLRLEYHLDASPAFVYAEKREEHWYADPSNDKLQRSYAYSDGLGREVLTKRTAEPDADGNARWIGTGRTVFDNKGDPVKRYEPYFSANTDYDSVFNGVVEIVRRDPLGRVVRTEHANGTHARVAFGELVWSGTAWTPALNAWGQVAYDENDTVGEPGNTWYARMSSGTTEQRDAAGKALAHADTPTRTHVDPLGRTWLTEQDNGLDTNGQPQLFPTQVELDIQGHARRTTDARALVAATHVVDMIGNSLFTHSADAGDTTALHDALDAVAREWNPNGIAIEHEYDPLRRPTRVWATIAGRRRLVERTFYGETPSDGATGNLRGRVFRQLDGAGMVTHEYDFKGNLAKSIRRLTKTYDQAVDWFDAPDPTATTQLPSGIEDALVPGEEWPTTTSFDALNRIKQLTVPGSATADDVLVPAYNETGLLDSVRGTLAGGTQQTLFVANIDYNEKGQRTRIVYGSGVRTEYGYEQDTFRLSTVYTFRTPATQTPDLQALSYSYDAVGNVTTLTDQAQQTYFVGNSIVSPTTKHTYDAIYRLIGAQGREHAGQASMDQTATPDGVPIPSPNDPQAMRNYAQSYSYDAVGNFLSLVHKAFQGPTAAGWTRTYAPDATSNRLLSTQAGDGTTSTTVTYAYDLAGNMTSMQSGSLPTLDWDYRNQLVHAVGSRGQSYFAYDATGQRVRKVLVNGTTLKERIYLGAYEVQRERTISTGAIALERRTIHVNDDKRRIALVERLVVGTPATASNVNDGQALLIRFELGNHLGSAVLELDTTGKIISYEEYHPFGTSAYRATDSVLEKNPKRYAFAAKERDDETGLYYFGARFYAPWLGRWTSADPAGMVDGANLYAYVRNNPINLVDPNGRESWFSATVGRAAGGAWGALTNFGGFLRLGLYDSWAQSFSDSSAQRVSDAQDWFQDFYGAVGDHRFLAWSSEGFQKRLDAIEQAENRGDHFGAGKVFGDTAMTAYSIGRGAIGLGRGAFSFLGTARAAGLGAAIRGVGYSARYWATTYEGVGIRSVPSLRLNIPRGSDLANYATFRAARIVARYGFGAEQTLDAGKAPPLRAVRWYQRAFGTRLQAAARGTAINRLIDARLTPRLQLKLGIQIQRPLGTNAAGNTIFPDVQLTVDGQVSVIDPTTPRLAGKGLKYNLATNVIEPLTGTRYLRPPPPVPPSLNPGHHQ